MGKGGRREEEGGRKEKGGYETPEVEKGGMRANQKHQQPYKKTVKQKRQGPNNAPATKQNICGQAPHLTSGKFDPYVAQGSDPMVSDPMVSDMSAHVHKNIHSSGSNIYIYIYIYIYISTPPHKEETLLIKRVS